MGSIRALPAWLRQISSTSTSARLLLGLRWRAYPHPASPLHVVCTSSGRPVLHPGVRILVVVVVVIPTHLVLVDAVTSEAVAGVCTRRCLMLPCRVAPRRRGVRAHANSDVGRPHYGMEKREE